jgi:hypothetical protein
MRWGLISESAVEARGVGAERAVLAHELREDALGVADDRDVSGDILRDLGRVDVDVDELRPRRELGQLAGDAVVEPGPDGADQVGLVHRVVRRARAVHPEHPEPLLVGGGEGPEAHDRARHREAVGHAQLGQLLRRLGVHDPAARVDHRPPRVRECLGRELDLLGVALDRGLVARQVDAVDRLVVDVGAREVLGHVDEHGSGAPGARDVEGLVDRPRDVARVLDQDRVLDDRHGDPGRVRLLKAVRPDQVGPDLAGDEHRRDRVEHRVGDRGDEVGRAGTARRERHPDLAARLGIALGGVARPGLVATQDVADAAVVQSVVGREVGPPG